MNRRSRQLPIIGRPTKNILENRLLKKANQRHRKAIKNVKGSLDFSVPKSMKMKHLKLRLNTRVQRVRKAQLMMEENERMLARYALSRCNGYALFVDVSHSSHISLFYNKQDKEFNGRQRHLGQANRKVRSDGTA